MQNPFESGKIKNYILLYASVVLIMVLFFIATTLFHNVKHKEKKVFHTTLKESNASEQKKSMKHNITQKFQLMKQAY